jgi:hypothetical protein
MYGLDGVYQGADFNGRYGSLHTLALRIAFSWVEAGMVAFDVFLPLSLVLSTVCI